MGPGKLRVVTRLVATGTDTTTRSSSVTRWMDGSANAMLGASKRKLMGNFIFEVADRGREPTVEGHVGVAEQTKTQLEIERLGKCFLLKNPAPDDLAGDGGQHFVLARGQNVDPADFRLLMELLGAELDRFAGALVLRLVEGGLEEHLLEEIGVIKLARITLQERHRCEFGLLRVQIPGLLKLEQRTEVVRAGGVDDDDPLALFELAKQMVSLECRP